MISQHSQQMRSSEQWNILQQRNTTTSGQHWNNENLKKVILNLINNLYYYEWILDILYNKTVFLVNTHDYTFIFRMFSSLHTQMWMYTSLWIFVIVFVFPNDIIRHDIFIGDFAMGTIDTHFEFAPHSSRIFWFRYSFHAWNLKICSLYFCMDIDES